MSSAPAVILESPQSGGALRPIRGGAMGGKGAWALGDQCAVSFGNFMTVILLARNLPLTEFAIYAILFDGMLFLNSINTALIGYPLSVKGAAADRLNLRQLCMASILWTLILGVPLGAMIFTGSWILARWTLAPWALLALLLWQVQEILRRALIAQLKTAEALPGDAVSYIGQILIIAWLAHRGWLSLETTFFVVAVTSLAAAGIQWIQVRPIMISRRQLRETGDVFWKLGYWNLFSSFAALFTIPSFGWVLGAFHGLRIVAIYQSFANLIKVSNPIMNTVSNMIVPAGARAKAAGGVPAAARAAWAYSAQGALILGPYLFVLGVFPKFAVHMAYGAHAASADYTPMLQVFVLGTVLLFIAQSLNAFLLSLESSRKAFAAQLANAGAAICIGLPLTSLFGIGGAVWGNLLATTARVVASLILVRQITGSSPAWNPKPEASPCTA